MTMQSPAVVELQLKDIDLKGGVSERERLELVDWTKFLTTSDNVDAYDYGALTKRKALTDAKLFSGSLENMSPMYRILANSTGYGVLGSNFQVFYRNDTLAQFVNKGRMPELHSSRIPVSQVPTGEDGTIGFGGTVTSAFVTPFATGLTENIVVVSSPLTSRCQITLVDPESGASVTRSSNDGSLFSVGKAEALVGAKSLAVGSGSVVYWLVPQTNGAGTKTGYYIVTVDTSASAAPVFSLLAVDNTVGTQDLVAARVMPGGNIAVVLSGGDIRVIDATGVIHSATITAAFTPTSLAVDGVSGDVYVIGITSPTNGTTVEQYPSDLSSVTRTLANAGATTWDSDLFFSAGAVDASGNLWVVESGQTDSAVHGVQSRHVEVFKATPSDVSLPELGTNLANYLSGWYVFVSPWYNSVTGRIYTVLLKSTTNVTALLQEGDTGSTCAIADITEYATEGYSFRPAGSIGGFTCVTKRVFTDLSGQELLSNGSFFAPLLEQNTPGVYASSVVEVTASSPANISSSGDVNSGGVSFLSDGSYVNELGFVDRPTILTGANFGAGVVEAGARNYVAVFEWLDSSGRVARSATSNVFSYTFPASTQFQMRITKCSLTSKGVFGSPVSGAPKEFNQVRTSVYRTKVGGTQFFFVGTVKESTYGGGSNYHTTFIDNIPDSLLGAVFYRAPGTPNGPLDRFAPPSSSHVVLHKDRYFWACGTTIYYSSFLVDGEQPWTNGQFSIVPSGGTGPITGLASMDGVLVVFKEDSVFIVDGDGPPENGGSGTEFSFPRKILTEFGCLDPRTIVSTPVGVFYRSVRGIELLTRGLQVTWVGERVRSTVDAHPYSGGACYDRETSRVMFPLGTASSSGRIAASGTGAVAVYYTDTDTWTVFRYNLPAGYGKPVQDVATVASLWHSPTTGRAVAFIDGSYAYFESRSSSSADEVFVPYKIETGWIRSPSMQDRIRVQDFLFLGKKVSNHNLSISVAYDYSSTYSYTKTWTAADLAALSLEQLEVQLPKPVNMAVRFKIEDSAPADTVTYPIGTGAGVDILALTPKAGVKGGGAKLSAAQKG